MVTRVCWRAYIASHTGKIVSLEFVNIASYRFVTLQDRQLPEIREALKAQACAYELKGTILLSSEGINLFVAGTRDHIDQYKAYLDSWSSFRNLCYKESFSDYQPFTRMLVRIKKEIIAMGHDEIEPEKKTATHLDPKTLKRWYEVGKEFVILDARNDYEVRIGAFDNAVDLDIHHFRDFPEAVEQLPEAQKEIPVVTYCTGGIRCEKAAMHMLNKGFKEVYQLEGGILNYFEECGGDNYHGECFVFDKRVAVDAALKETSAKQCYACREPLLVDEQSDDETCPHCHKNRNGKRYIHSERYRMLHNQPNDSHGSNT